MTTPRRWQRVSAYGLARRESAVLMVRIGDDTHGDVDKWMLPGGGVDHGEDPADTVVREFAEETGYHVQVDALLEVGSDHRLLPSGVDFHGVFALYAVSVISGTTRDEPDGSTTAPTWVGESDIARLPMLVAVRHMLQRHLR
ncbi:NUDIX domain-containing protein [Micromonospora sp. DR5-3]|uniref:NUDIX hydrolase n=1 Tax=unclassified Micromonospora TaxID=2617518 RepID=UPI0011D8B7BD|nr:MULTISPECIES: NUDIX domain-containing protein [unclassified Micromonospora]MCW3815101.1 NUDIX domain-containing protein [Micromonospora sp. DR5-3]TYC21982.1 NUDIX domain-containing protein [Micromonospora sp. MP36]